MVDFPRQTTAERHTSLQANFFERNCGLVSFVALSDNLPVPIIRTLMQYGAKGFFEHHGSWSGCGGNPDAIRIACGGSGNCTAACKNCGAYSFYTCCGSNEEGSQYCDELIESVAKENAKLSHVKFEDRVNKFPSYHRGPR
eukprot:PhF_6_TR9100/c0_g1_i1/m.14168